MRGPLGAEMPSWCGQVCQVQEQKLGKRGQVDRLDVQAGPGRWPLWKGSLGAGCSLLKGLERGADEFRGA